MALRDHLGHEQYTGQWVKYSEEHCHKAGTNSSRIRAALLPPTKA
jgi:hypothetical protein